jgi:TonB-linked SusC/RagA family outer membrane protein
MSGGLRRTVLATVCVCALATPLAAQEPSTVTGRVRAAGGAPLAGATVSIPQLSLSATSREDGRYAIVVPSALASRQNLVIIARRVGYKPQSAPLVLAAGGATHDFVLDDNPLQLGEVVITGLGTTTEAEKLGNVRNTVSSQAIEHSNEGNIVQALAGKAPGVNVTGSSGEPGASSTIRIRGLRTITGNASPLFVIDGTPVDNSSYSTTNFNPVDGLGTGEVEGTTQPNRLLDFNPADIENIEILKGAAASAIYGSRAANGVVLITMKRGRAGDARYSLRSSLSNDNISRYYPLQTAYGQGNLGHAPTSSCTPDNTDCFRSWGPAVTQTFDHASEAFTTGHVLDNTLSVSGGNDRTTYYLSGSSYDNRGIFVGPNNQFDRKTVRATGSQRLGEKVNVTGNLSYSDTRGLFTQRGNNTNALLLGLLRTPPDFNNLPFLDPVSGLHRSFRFANPGPESAGQDRGFSNPFFTLYEELNRATASRSFGNVNASWQATDWLKFDETFGADYSNDERLEGCPQECSGPGAGGRVTEGNLVNYQLDHNLIGTATRQLTSRIKGSLTLGQNLNNRDFRTLSVVGRGLIAPQPFSISNTTSRDLPSDFRTEIRTEAYFGQATVELYDEVFLTGALRNDGSSTFGTNNRHNWFPKASAAWNLTERLASMPGVSAFKVRAALGEAGIEPLPYLTETLFSGITPIGGFVQGTGFLPTQSGLGGLSTALNEGAADLRPERTRELEGGFDAGLFNNRVDLSFTLYKARSRDVILITPVAPSSGFFNQTQNSAEFENRGTEVSLNVRPISSEKLSWEVGAGWARNRGFVRKLTTATFVTLDGNSALTPLAVAKQGEEIGVFYDFGFARCGMSPNGMDAVIAGVDLATVCAGKPYGATYIGADGLPVRDPNQRVIGNPNPRWTGNVHSNLRFGNFELTGLLDIKHGGDIYNGTKGALWSYGTHEDTQIRATCTGTTTATCTGNEQVFGANGFFDTPTVGPGAGKSIPIGQNFWRNGPMPCPFTNTSEPCIEDGSYVKLREISVGYTLSSGHINSLLNLSSIDLRLAGRNLKTWTKYSGLDPETNLGGSIEKTQGIDYFNMPQTRSFVITVGLQR